MICSLPTLNAALCGVLMLKGFRALEGASGLGVAALFRPVCC